MSFYSLQILLTTRIRNRLKLKYEPSMTVSGATSHTVHLNPFIRLDPEVVNYVPAQFSPDERYTQFFDVAKFQSLMRRQLQRGMQPKRTLEQAIKDGTLKNNIQITIDTLLKGPLVVRGEEYAVFSKEWDGQFTQKDPAFKPPTIPPKPPTIPPKPPAIPPKPSRPPSISTNPILPSIPARPVDDVPSTNPKPLQLAPPLATPRPTPLKPPRPTPKMRPERSLQFIPPKNSRESVVLRPLKDKEWAKTDPMTREKALEILELEPNPSLEQISKQFTRLLISSQFANKDKLREAREFLEQWATSKSKPPPPPKSKQPQPNKTQWARPPLLSKGPSSNIQRAKPHQPPLLPKGPSSNTRRAKPQRPPLLTKGPSTRATAHNTTQKLRQSIVNSPVDDFPADNFDDESNFSSTTNDSDTDSDVSVESTYNPIKPAQIYASQIPVGNMHKTVRNLKSIATRATRRRQQPTVDDSDTESEGSSDDGSEFSSDSDTTNYRGGKRTHKRTRRRQGGAPIRYNANDDRRRLTMRNRYRYDDGNRYNRSSETSKTFYVTVKLELFPGKTVPLKWQAKLACQSQYERVRENYADMMGLQYLPNELYIPSSETYTKPEANKTDVPIGVGAQRPYKNAQFDRDWV